MERRSGNPASAIAGIAAPLLLAAVFVALTLDERAFLSRTGWSPVKRTRVEWPSLLELGPHGWILQVAFVTAGALGFAFAFSLWRRAPSRTVAFAGVALVLLAVATACMAFPPDRPDVVGRSWHDAAHNGIYPVIPLAALGAALAFSSMPGAGAPSRERVWRRASRVFAAAGTAALGVTFVPAIAQLGRFVYFGLLLGWVASIAAGDMADASE